MPDQFITVSFPESRTVESGGTDIGLTNLTLRLNAGTHTFTLSGLQNYTPASQRIVVNNTSAGNPLPIVFTKVAAAPSAAFTDALSEAKAALGNRFPADFWSGMEDPTVDAFAAGCAAAGIKCVVEKDGTFGKARATAVLGVDPVTNETWILSALEQASAAKHFHVAGGPYGEMILSLVGQLYDVADDGTAVEIVAQSVLVHGPATTHQPSADVFWMGLFHQPRGATPTL